MYEDVVTVLTGHTTQENAFVNDHPYGRHRTDRKNWVETAEKGSKKGQQRYMTCTLNPKTQRWNNPKKSTYSDVIVLYLNEDEHVKAAHLHVYTKREDAATFVERFGEHLTDAQWKTVKLLCAYRKVSDRITWKVCEPGETPQSPEEQNKIIAAMVAQELRKQPQTA